MLGAGADAGLICPPITTLPELMVPCVPLLSLPARFAMALCCSSPDLLDDNAWLEAACTISSTQLMIKSIADGSFQMRFASL